MLRPPPLQLYATFLVSTYTVKFTLRPCTLFSRSTFRSVSSSSCLRAEASCLSRSLISPRILYNHNHIFSHHLPGLHGISKGRFSRLFATMQTTGTHVPIGHDCVIPKSLGRIFAAGQSAPGSFTNPFSEFYYYKGYLIEIKLPINQNY